MNKEKKTEKTLAEEKCFSISETDKFIYYICKGVSGNIYDVIYHKGFDRWTCNCDNIRKTSCYHIDTAEKIKENENPESDIEFANIPYNT